MKVVGKTDEGMFTKGNELHIGDLFLIDTGMVTDELASFTEKRGVSFPYVVESINDDKNIVYAKFCEIPIPHFAIIKIIKD